MLVWRSGSGEIQQPEMIDAKESGEVPTRTSLNRQNSCQNICWGYLWNLNSLRGTIGVSIGTAVGTAEAARPGEHEQLHEAYARLYGAEEGPLTGSEPIGHQ